MKLLFSRGFSVLLLLLCAALAFGAYWYLTIYLSPTTTTAATSVSLGDVVVEVSASGRTEAEAIAHLGFPTTGTVREVFKFAGDEVMAGDIIASLTQDSIIAEYNAALEVVRRAEAERADLRRGAQSEQRATSRTSVEIAAANLDRITKEQTQLVRNARVTLLSTDLEAVPTNPLNYDQPPRLSGSYLCDEEGSYNIALFRSYGPTNYSYVLGGLESDASIAYVDTPAPLGSCGILIQFEATEIYRDDTWTVTIPNQRSPRYIANLNAYNLAQEQANNAIAGATQALELAQRQDAEVNAPPATEALAAASARIAEAEAALAIRAAHINDLTIRAPFSGQVTLNSLRVGEVAGPGRTITLMATGAYELKARVPEIDITRVMVGQSVSVYFDAEPNTAYAGRVTYLSPYSEQISGVAYFEAKLSLDQPPTWIRSGLNADIKILASERRQVPTLGNRYLLRAGNDFFVLIDSANGPQRQPVEVGLRGTNGLTEILNLPVGTSVLLP